RAGVAAGGAAGEVGGLEGARAGEGGARDVRGGVGRRDGGARDVRRDGDDARAARPLRGRGHRAAPESREVRRGRPAGAALAAGARVEDHVPAAVRQRRERRSAKKEGTHARTVARGEAGVNAGPPDLAVVAEEAAAVTAAVAVAGRGVTRGGVAAEERGEDAPGAAPRVRGGLRQARAGAGVARRAGAEQGREEPAAVATSTSTA